MNILPRNLSQRISPQRDLRSALHAFSALPVSLQADGLHRSVPSESVSRRRLSAVVCLHDLDLSDIGVEMAGRPYLETEIDEHSADAGVTTRYEAVLDSLKGLPAARQTQVVTKSSTSIRRPTICQPKDP